MNKPLTEGYFAVQDSPVSPCWLWTRHTTTDGYGQLMVRAKTWLAHRYMWTVMRGPIPEGMELDHLCRNRRCVNPDHLEVVTHRENLLRGSRCSVTHCPQGHPYDLVNTYWHPNGQRVCRECKRAFNRTYKRTRRAKVAV